MVVLILTWVDCEMLRNGCGGCGSLEREIWDHEY
jgi:hypothetical protein